MRPIKQCITVTAVNLFSEVLPKQFEALASTFLKEKKQVTAEYWVSLGSKGFCRQKCQPFFVCQKVQISSKNLPQIPNFASLQSTILVYLLNFASFVKNQHCRHDGLFSSFRQFFVKNEIPWSPVITVYIHHRRQLLHAQRLYSEHLTGRSP